MAGGACGNAADADRAATAANSEIYVFFITGNYRRKIQIPNPKSHIESRGTLRPESQLPAAVLPIWFFGIWFFGIWFLGFGFWDPFLGFVLGIWDLGFGIWDLGFGIWDLGFLISNTRRNSRPKVARED